MPTRPFLLSLLPILALALLSACSNPSESAPAAAESKAAPPPIIKALSPKESIATMELPNGYRLEPVLTEPDIAEPVMVSSST
jgi:hypothetical protein